MTGAPGPAPAPAAPAAAAPAAPPAAAPPAAPAPAASAPAPAGARPRALLVGAGAVGVVYARHLAKGGAEVAFLVRPKYAEALRAGVALYPLNERAHRRSPARLAGYAVLTDASEAAGRGFDQVWLCVSSTALRQGGGEWLRALASATGDATVVSLQPGIEDRAYIAQRIPEARLVAGMIPFSSWHAPLAGEDLPEPGYAYWVPPVPFPFSGPRERVEPVVAALARGGLAARVHPDVGREAAFASALLMAIVGALEATGWRFAGVRRGEGLRIAQAVAREATAAVAARLGKEPPLGNRLIATPLGALAIGAVSLLAPRVLPFDVETFFRVHFTKVGDQSRLGFRTYRDLAIARGLPHAALDRLIARLDQLDAEHRPASGSADAGCAR